MINAPMFKKFVLPYLEREAAYFNNRVFYHWDGVTALTHTEDLIASKNLFALSFVPGAGNGTHVDYLDLYEKIQEKGKAVAVGGNADEVKYMHKRLKPEKTTYSVRAESEKEGYELLKWFKNNT